MIKELERYLGVTHSNKCQPSIITKTPATFTEPEMPTIIPDTGAKRPKTNKEMTYLENNNIDKAVCQKPRKKDAYKTNMHKIYNLMVGQINDKLKENAALDATLQ